jgi:hypothetical protein
MSDHNVDHQENRHHCPVTRRRVPKHPCTLARGRDRLTLRRAARAVSDAGISAQYRKNHFPQGGPVQVVGVPFRFSCVFFVLFFNFGCLCIPSFVFSYCERQYCSGPSQNIHTHINNYFPPQTASSRSSPAISFRRPTAACRSRRCGRQHRTMPDSTIVRSGLVTRNVGFFFFFFFLSVTFFFLIFFLIFY